MIRKPPSTTNMRQDSMVSKYLVLGSPLLGSHSTLIALYSLKRLGTEEISTGVS